MAARILVLSFGLGARGWAPSVHTGTPNLVSGPCKAEKQDRKPSSSVFYRRPSIHKITFLSDFKSQYI